MNDIHSEGRFANRVPYRVQVILRSLHDLESAKSAVSLDLNLLGLQVFSQYIISPYEEFLVSLMDFDTQERLDIRSRVVWTLIDEIYCDSPYWLRAGIQFAAPLTAEQESTLKQMLGYRIDRASQSRQRKHLMAVLP